MSLKNFLGFSCPDFPSSPREFDFLKERNSFVTPSHLWKTKAKANEDDLIPYKITLFEKKVPGGNPP